MTDKSSDTVRQYLTFMMGEENYAIPVTDIREVLLVPKITRIPKMPDFMKGVINLRGSVVPILDLKMRFGMGETASSTETAIIVVEIPLESGGDGAGFMHLGIFADAVKKVVAIASGDIEPPPSIGSRIKTAFIEGMGRVDNEFIVILDIKEVLTAEDMEMMESASSAEATA